LGKENNGTTIAAMNLIRYLKERGHEVRVVSPDKSRAEEPGFYTLPARHFGPLDSVFKANGVQLSKPDEDVLRAAIEGADVVHILLPFVTGKAAAKIANELGIPATISFHMMAENLTAHLGLADARPLNFLVYKHITPVYRRCFAVHYPTQYLRGLFESISGPTNGYVISNGVNKCFRPMEVSRPKALKGRYTVLYTGRYSREKSQWVLIDAIDRSKYRDEIQLVLAGSGPYLKTLQKRAEKLPIPPIFRFFSREDMIKMINAADLYVHPAETEAEGISCLEAVSCGLVPIISDSPRCATKSYALDEKDLFRYNDPEDLAKKIDWWLAHPEARKARGEEYVRYAAERFDQDRCMAMMEQMLTDARDGYVRHAAK
jgi:glycosyltransferase involved in cell wall biosynthesis